MSDLPILIYETEDDVSRDRDCGYVSPAFAKPVLGAVPFVNEVACVDWEDAIKQVFTNTIDLVLTDPPYGMAYRSNRRKEKPTNLLRHLIEKSTNKGDLVLDTFAGSFSTARACKEIGRDFICFEVEPEYCRTAKNLLNGVSVSLF